LLVSSELVYQLVINVVMIFSDVTTYDGIRKYGVEAAEENPFAVWVFRVFGVKGGFIFRHVLGSFIAHVFYLSKFYLGFYGYFFIYGYFLVLLYDSVYDVYVSVLEFLERRKLLNTAVRDEGDH